jgi:hypothetical protein
MSYSYLKNVFPNFESSMNYQNKVYNEININNEKDRQIKPIENTSLNKLNLFTQSLIGAPYVNTQEKTSQAPASQVPASQVPTITSSRVASSQVPTITSSRVASSQVPSYAPLDTYAPSSYIPSSSLIEKFGEDELPEQQFGCDMYIRHILGCQKCRSIIMKQWNMDNDRIRNEEIMEVVTYIVFGIFVLLLIDLLKNK